MSRKALQINVSERTRQLIRSESNRRKSGAGYKKRLQIIYHSSLGLENKETAELLECRVSTVRRWRARWQNSEAMILGLEKDHNQEETSDIKLLGAISLVLSDAPRTGAPARLTDSEKVRLQALACESPRCYGLPFNVWTHAELSAQASRMGMEISPAHYGKLLKKRVEAPQIDLLAFSEDWE